MHGIHHHWFANDKFPGLWTFQAVARDQGCQRSFCKHWHSNMRGTEVKSFQKCILKMNDHALSLFPTTWNYLATYSYSIFFDRRTSYQLFLLKTSMSPQRLCTSKEKSPSPAPYHPSIVWQQFQKVSPILVIANLEKMLVYYGSFLRIVRVKATEESIMPCLGNKKVQHIHFLTKNNALVTKKTSCISKHCKTRCEDKTRYGPSVF